MHGRPVWFIGLLSGLLAACGGGGPSGTTVEVVVTDTYNNPTNPLAAAKQVGAGAWQSLQPSETGLLRLQVPSGETRYGVAINCSLGLGLGSIQLAKAYQLTTTEATRIHAVCPTFSGNNSKIAGTVDTGLGMSSEYKISTSFSDGSSQSNGSTYELYLPSRPNAEIIVLGLDSSSVLQRARIVRGLNATGNLPGQNFTLSAADAVTPQTVNPFSVPAGFTGSYSITLRSKQNVYAKVGSGTVAGGSYAVIPGASSDDLFFATANASTGLGEPKRQVSQTRSFSTPSALTFSLPAEWPSSYTVAPAALPSFTNLTHLSGDPQFRAYRILLVSSPFGFFGINISKGWLAGNTSYTVPDLGNVSGFAAKPYSGDEVRWLVQAVVANKPLGDLLSSAPAMLGEEAILGLGHAALPDLEYKTTDISNKFIVP